MPNRPEPILFASDSRGIYIPQFFAECVRRECVANVGPDDWADLEAGPDSETYWDTWADVEARAVVTDRNTGTVYRLYQDGDLWLVPEGMEASEHGFRWPDESAE